MSINEDRSQRVCGELSVGSPLIGGKVIICADNCDDFTNSLTNAHIRLRILFRADLKTLRKYFQKMPILSKINKEIFYEIETKNLRIITGVNPLRLMYESTSSTIEIT